MERKAPNRDLTDLERRASNVVRIGTIAAADYLAARVRVKIGPITTAWLPFIALRAHDDVTWHPPEVGEQVLIVAVAGDLAQGVVVGAIYQHKHPAPADKPEISRQVWADGAVREYDREGHHYLLDVPAGGSITLRIGRTELVLRDDGVTLNTPDFEANQS